jgi:hypothetical protein
MMTLSTNGAYLVLGGYNCVPTTAAPANALPTAVNRMVGRVDASGNIDVTTALTDILTNGTTTGYAIRSVASVDGSGFWISGNGGTGFGGIYYAALGATSGTNLTAAAAPTNNRNLGIFKGQLYVGSGSGGNHILTVGTGLPTTPTASMADFVASLSSGPYGFHFADLDAGVAGVDTLYIADGTTTIKKYCLETGVWTARGIVTMPANSYGLTARTSGSTVTLYITASGLYSIVDATGYGASMTDAYTTVVAPAAMTTNTAFRGVAFTPGTTTVVSLTSFTAQGLANQVNVTWSTGSEVDAAGFNVWRADKADGTFAKVNAALLPAKGVSPAGASYTWNDPNVSVGQTYFYKLEDVDTSGVRTLHGPVSATVGATSAILSFQATPPSIFLGGRSLLNWTVNGAPALSILGMGPVTGSSLSVAPTATTSYTLTDGKATSLATVTVRPFALKDLPGLSKAWGSAKGQAAYDPCYDLNSDGKVDDTDVALSLK